MHVLIAGASIAGPTLAWWLDRFGFAVTIVEKAPAPRPGGHAIDVRGAGLDVVQAMGLLDPIRAARTQMKGVSKLNAAGNEIWRSEEMTISGGSFGKEAIEIMRDDLSSILVGALPSSVELIYGDSIASLADTGSAVDVDFNHGDSRRFDLVIGADGLPSALRRMVFGPDNAFIHPFGAVLAPFSAPNLIGLEDWQLTYDAGDGNCMIYTAPGNQSLRVSFGFDAAFDEIPAGRAEQIALVRQRCAHMGWHVPALLDAMDEARDFYLGAIAQVKMDRWHKGRIALVGDAAYCPSPFTGQGTSLAVVGAYVLACNLARYGNDFVSAFAAWEASMRPFVAKNQAIADLTRNPEFASNPDYYLEVIEPAMEAAEYAIELDGLERTA